MRRSPASARRSATRYGIDPTFVRIGFVAAAIFISFKLTLVAYAALGIYLDAAEEEAR